MIILCMQSVELKINEYKDTIYFIQKMYVRNVYRIKNSNLKLILGNKCDAKFYLTD